MASLSGKTVVLGVTGGISAYKSAELVRLLRKADAQVRVVMTKAACEFITPLTLQTLSNHPVARDLFDAGQEAEIGHIRLADEADLMIVAPATADSIARMAAGRADDLLAAVALATRAPLLLAPAMNVNMWENPLTQDNLRRLLTLGRVSTVGPDRGELACGWIGAGRLVDPAEIVSEAEALLARRPARGALVGRKVVVTAGPTFEAVDDVRFLGNRSSGKMGFALAAAAAGLGAEVTLIAGPVALGTPLGVQHRRDVESALEMQAALTEASANAQVIVMTAAVADFRPEERFAGKLSRRNAAGTGKRDQTGLSLRLVANPDLLAGLGARRASATLPASRGAVAFAPFIVGFAAETGLEPAKLIQRARAKLIEKKCDVVVANDVGTPGLGFGSDRNAVLLVTNDDAVPLGPSPKAVLAEEIWAALIPRLPPTGEATAPSVLSMPARTRKRRAGQSGRTR